MLSRPIPGEVYKHFKGNLYRIVTIASHSETGEELVVYQALYGEYQVYARPLSMFVEPVDKEKYPEVLQNYRFEKVHELIQPVETEYKMSSEKIAETSAVAQVSENEKNITTKDVTEVSNGEEFQLDPLVLEFLDAGTYEERLNILSALHHRITDEMITTMALSVDLEIEDGEVEDRYEELKNCLLTFERYEGNRLR